MPLSSVQEIANDILADQTCKRLYVVRTSSLKPGGIHMSCTRFGVPADGSRRLACFSTHGCCYALEGVLGSQGGADVQRVFLG